MKLKDAEDAAVKERKEEINSKDKEYDEKIKVTGLNRKEEKKRKELEEEEE